MSGRLGDVLGSSRRTLGDVLGSGRRTVGHVLGSGRRTVGDAWVAVGGLLGTRTPEPVALGPAERARLHALREQVDDDRLRRDLEALPGPRNRLHSPEAMATADRQLLDAFDAAGWNAERRPFELRGVTTSIDHGDFRQPQHHDRLAGANIVATKPGATSNEVVVVVAHHDTVRDSPGADDNGASVVALMGLARLLGGDEHDRTVLLAAVDMEELGLVGSRQLVADLRRRVTVADAFVYETMAYSAAAPHTQRLPPGFGVVYPEQVRALADRDWVGDFTTVIHRSSCTAAATRFATALQALDGPHATVMVREPTDLPVVGTVLRRYIPLVQHFARSDHLPFWEAGLPAVWITDSAEFRNPNYHRPSDVPDTIDYRRLGSIVAATAAAVDTSAGLRPR